MQINHALWWLAMSLQCTCNHLAICSQQGHAHHSCNVLTMCLQYSRNHLTICSQQGHAHHVFAMFSQSSHNVLTKNGDFLKKNQRACVCSAVTIYAKK